jgi:FkbM family methyltransferase
MLNNSELFNKYLDKKCVPYIDLIGAQYLRHILTENQLLHEMNDPRTMLHEECFEWIELLKSIENAKKGFTFVELGAGYGRWSVRAYKACIINKIKPSDIKLILVEGEPQHSQWAKEHLSTNNIPRNSFVFKEGLMAQQKGKGEIVVHLQDGLNGVQTAKNWYGQCHVPSAKDDDILMKDTYLGKKLLIDKNGIGRVVCETFTLEEILSEDAVVDLLNMDIQGSEYNVVASSLDVICSKVKKVYISTHSNQIDEYLYNQFNDLKWLHIHSYPFQQISNTEFGMIEFGDGIQVWENPIFK